MTEENEELDAKFVLRLPTGLRDDLARAAKQNGRSANAEYIVRLKESLANTPPKPSNLTFRTKAEADVERELLKTARAFGPQARALEDRVEALEADVTALKARK